VEVAPARTAGRHPEFVRGQSTRHETPTRISSFVTVIRRPYDDILAHLYRILRTAMYLRAVSGVSSLQFFPPPTVRAYGIGHPVKMRAQVLVPTSAQTRRPYPGGALWAVHAQMNRAFSFAPARRRNAPA